MKDWLKRAATFYWRCVKLAFSKAWTISGATGAVVGLAVPPILKRYPAFSWLNDLPWLVPLSILTIVFVPRLLLAPFWLYESVTKATKAPAQADLSLAFDKEDSVCWAPRKVVANNGVCEADLRLGVVNLGGAQVENVELVIVASQPMYEMPLHGFRFLSYPDGTPSVAVPVTDGVSPSTYFSVANVGINTSQTPTGDRPWMRVEPYFHEYDRTFDEPRFEMTLRLQYANGSSQWKFTIEQRDRRFQAGLAKVAGPWT